MKITFREAQNLGIWDKVCELSDINPWAVKEGWLRSDEVIDVEVKEKS